MSRIYLVDDHTLVRDALRALLRTGGHEVVGEANDAASAFAGISAETPDLVLLDVGLEGHSGFDLLVELARRPDAPPTLMLTMSLDARDVERALELGARGYLLKNATRDEMLGAIATVLDGQRHYGPELALLAVGAAGARDLKALALLSARERQIFEMVVRGRSSAAIASALALSPKTVDTYRSRLGVKLGVEGVADLVRFAVRSGVLDPRD